jgi:methylenetetrahydrofolate dehydrogenase (NADP+) / methenyltetrahydrofolate cyclohydrolase
MGQVLSGRTIAAELNRTIARDVEALRQEYGVRPRIALLTADLGDLVKQSEMRVHEEAARDLGIEVRTTVLDANAQQAELIRAIRAESDDPTVHGVLVLLPLPPHMDQDAVFAAIAQDKEIEGLGLDDEESASPFDVEAVEVMMTEKRSSTLRAVRLLLDSVDFNVQGSRNVFITEDEVQDNPIVLRLLELSSSVNVSVAVASITDPKIRSVTRSADLVVVSLTRPDIVDETYLKMGSVVIDFNPVMVGEKYSEKKQRPIPVLKGGVNVDSALRRASYVAPGVGGLGPVVVSSLLLNLVINCRSLLESGSLHAVAV